MQYQHTNCGGLIKNCPNNDEAFCDQCGKWVNENDILENETSNIIDICSRLEQGSSTMTQSNDDFELSNCNDPKCYICTMHKDGYPSESQIEDGRLKLNSYHKKQLAESMVTLLNWIGGAA